MKKDNLKFTIITVCYNSINTIEKTIKSVVSQSYKNFEYIVIDGGSNDGTVELIKKYKDSIDNFISEDDKGIYDAFNKGINLSNGEYISILNSDDTYNPNTLELVSKYTSNEKNTIIYGDTYFIDDNDVIFSENKGEFNSDKIKAGVGFMHPSCFISKEVYNKIGLYEVSKEKSIASDADFLVKCYKANINFVKGEFRVFMRTGGVSENFFYKAHKQYLNSLIEQNVISKKEYKLEVLKLFIKAPFKKFLSRKAVAVIKLQMWVILIALFNFFLKYTPFTFLKKIILNFFKFRIGKDSHVHNSTFLSLGKFIMGNNSVINPKCIIDNRDNIIIGNNVSIGHYCKIYTTGHHVNCSYFTGLRKPVVIEDNVVLFSSCIVQPGVTIGEGAIVFPGSVVNKDIAPYSVAGGNPVKTINKRTTHLNYKINYGFKFIK